MSLLADAANALLNQRAVVVSWADDGRPLEAECPVCALPWGVGHRGLLRRHGAACTGSGALVVTETGEPAGVLRPAEVEEPAP